MEADRELGAGLPPDEFALAARYAVAETAELGRGLHDPVEVGSPRLVGLLVLEGLMVSSTQVADRRCGELVGPGELLRPWDHSDELARMPFEFHWRVIEPVRLALLDRRFMVVLARWPQLMHVIVERAVERSEALALSMAIHCLQHVELRLLVLFWHLADRFGHVTPDGVLIPLKLSHSDIAELAGSQRPSVSARLAVLAGRRELIRQPDRTWLLLGRAPEGIQDTRGRATVSAKSEARFAGAGGPRP